MTTNLDIAIKLWSNTIGIENIKLFFGLIIVLFLVKIFIDNFNDV